MIRHVIFDLDGTLIDSLPGIGCSVEAALAACGITAPPFDLKPLIGPPIRQILATVAGASDDPTLDRLERAFRSSYDSEGWRKTVRQPGATETLETLRARGMALWLVTNKPRLSTGMILRELALEAFFREVVCRDSQTPPFASKSQMVRDLLDRRGLDPRDCVLVGDTTEDAHAAEEAGIRCALVPHGYGKPTSRDRKGAVSLLRNWDDLLNYVERGGPPLPETVRGEAK